MTNGGAARPLKALAIEPTAIEWESVNSDGTKSATLAGSRDSGEMFTYAFFIPAGVYDMPHTHAADAHLIVASGVLSLGYGDRFAQEELHDYPAGSFLLVPAGAAHFDGSSQDTLLIGTATGPWDTVYVTE